MSTYAVEIKGEGWGCYQSSSCTMYLPIFATEVQAEAFAAFYTRPDWKYFSDDWQMRVASAIRFTIGEDKTEFPAEWGSDTWQDEDDEIRPLEADEIIEDLRRNRAHGLMTEIRAELTPSPKSIPDAEEAQIGGAA